MKTLRQALLTIVNADAQMQTLCGRPSDLCRWFPDLRSGPRPIVGYWIVDDRETGESGLHRRIMVQLSAVAEGQGGLTKVEDMDARLRAILTQAAFAAQTVDAAPVALRAGGDREYGAEEQALQVARRDLDLVLNVRVT